MNNRKPITIFRGDDTDALGYQTIVGTIDTTLDLTGCSATFKLLGIVRQFASIPSDKRLVITLSAADTKTLPPGLMNASIVIKDSNNKVRTFDNQIPVYVVVDTPMPTQQNDIRITFNAVPQLLGTTSFDMFSTDWELRQLVVKLAKYFGLTVSNETLPQE